MSTDRSLLLKLYAVSAAVAVVILGPMLRSLGDGRYLLYRDAVSTPRSYVTDSAVGVGGVPARAVPQDWLLAMLTPVVDGGVVVVALLGLGLMLAGVGFGRLAARAVPAAGHAGACFAAVVAVWNPFVAERLLQGHWSLLMSYAALGWVAVAVMDRPCGFRGWVVLAGLFAWAGFTPSGSVFAGVVAVTAVVASGAPGHRTLRDPRFFVASASGIKMFGRDQPAHAPERETARRANPTTSPTPNNKTTNRADPTTYSTPDNETTKGADPTTFLIPEGDATKERASRRVRRDGAPNRGVAIASAWVVGALPWVVASLVGGADATSSGAGVDAFGVRAEPGLGTLGTVAGLGGIWNADAVPGSRSVWWASVATIAFMVIVAIGVVELWRHQRDSRVWKVFAGCAVVALIAVAGPGESVLTWLVEEIPGAGLLRDTHKYVALAVPFYAIAAGAAISAVKRWVPAAFAVAAGLLLVVAPLPDLAWGVGGSIRTVALPDSFRQAAQVITPDHGMVAIYPPGQIRRYSFTGTTSLDPLPRMLRAPVVDAGALTVDGIDVDAPSGRGADVDAALVEGGDPGRLAALGVEWVVVEGGDLPAELGKLTPAMQHDDLTVYRIPGDIAATGASGIVRTAAWAAHLLWFAALLAGMVFAAQRAAKPSAVDDQE